ncbi:MAG: carbohydrate-binding protein [Bacilli bacterium]
MRSFIKVVCLSFIVIFSGISSVAASTTDTVAVKELNSPILFSMHARSTKIWLQWSEPTNATGKTTYGIFRNGTLVKTLDQLEFVDRNLATNTNYEYTVVATDASGKSGRSNTIAVKTTETEPTTLSFYDSEQVYLGGEQVWANQAIYQARWYTVGVSPYTAYTSNSPWILVKAPKYDYSYSPAKQYVRGDKVVYSGFEYEAQWWTQNETPGVSAVWKVIK